MVEHVCMRVHFAFNQTASRLVNYHQDPRVHMYPTGTHGPDRTGQGGADPFPTCTFSLLVGHAEVEQLLLSPAPVLTEIPTELNVPPLPHGISARLHGRGRGEPPAAGEEGKGEGRASGCRGTLGLSPRTISMILVFLPVFFFMVKMYCASTTPPTSAHTLALATAPILATAVLSMVVVPGAPGAAAGKRGYALGVGEGAESRRVLPDRTPGRQRRRRTRPAGPAPRRPYHATGERGRERLDARV